MIGDGCGRELDCGMCASGQTCSGGLCVPAHLHAPDLHARWWRPVLRQDRRRLRRLAGVPGLQRADDLRRRQHRGRLRHAGGELHQPAQLQSDGRPVLRRRRRQLRRQHRLRRVHERQSCRPDHLCPSTGPGPCQGLQCQLDKPGECTGAGTTISGSVFDPAGKVALYNVLLYVPNTALGPISTGARATAAIRRSPVAGRRGAERRGRQVQDHERAVGHEHPARHPDRQVAAKIILPTVTKCQDNAFNDPNTVRLPRSMSDRAAGDAAGDVHMPQIALSTGHSDALDCLLRKIGIADSEFTPDSGTGRVHITSVARASGDQGSKCWLRAGRSPIVRNAVPELRQDGRLRHDHAPVRGGAAREPEDPSSAT